MGVPNKALNKAGNPIGATKPKVSNQLIENACKEPDAVIKELESRPSGLSTAEAEARLKRYGRNEIAREKRQSPLMRLLDNVKNPLVILLTALGVLSYLTGDIRATVVIFVMVVLGVVLRFYQEMRADNAAEKLKAMVNITATVLRDGKDAEVALKFLVPGDIIRLNAGDMVPADVRVLNAKDLFLNQAALTGRIFAGGEKSRSCRPQTLKIHWSFQTYASWARMWKAAPHLQSFSIPGNTLILALWLPALLGREC